MRMYHRAAVRACGALAFALCGATAAQAQVTFEGYTDACVNSATCTPVADPGPQTVEARYGAETVLTYRGGSFAGMPAGPGKTTELSLGSFSLNTASSAFGYWDFALTTTFTRPLYHSEIFRAMLTGVVFMPGNGFAQVNFDNAPRIFGSTGQYTLRVEDVYLGTGSLNGVSFNEPTQNVVLKGYVTDSSTVTPEPVSLMLLGTGLAGLGAVRRRRRQEA